MFSLRKRQGMVAGVIALLALTFVFAFGRHLWEAMAYRRLFCPRSPAETPDPDAGNITAAWKPRSVPKVKRFDWLPGPEYIWPDAVCVPCELGVHAFCRCVIFYPEVVLEDGAPTGVTQDRYTTDCRCPDAGCDWKRSGRCMFCARGYHSACATWSERALSGWKSIGTTLTRCGCSATNECRGR